MGTALKILFSGDSMGPSSTVTQDHKKADIPFQLTRGEIVSLLNAFGRYVSNSEQNRGGEGSGFSVSRITGGDSS